MDNNENNASRLQFHCRACEMQGSRNESFKTLEDQNPAFTDICPRCGSDDIDVLDGEKSVIPENRGWDYRKDGPEEEVEDDDSESVLN